MTARAIIDVTEGWEMSKSNKLGTAITVMAIAIGLTCSGANASLSTNNAKNDTSSEASPHSGLNFSVRLKHSALTHLSGRHYQLTLPIDEIHQVLAFGMINGKRVGKNLTPELYAELVHTGKNSFENNPPNLALVFDNGGHYPFVLTSSKKHNDSIIYDLRALGSELPEEKSGGVAIYIDSACSELPGQMAIICRATAG